MKKVLKNNSKLIIGIILGLIWSMGIAYAATIYYASVNVSYDNTSSGLKATNVQDALDELYANSDAYLAGLNAAHPIGSIFMTVNSNDNTAAQVGAALGGTWEVVGEGRVLIGAGTNGTYTFSAGSTGGETVAGNVNTGTQTITNPLGEYTHKFVKNEMPSHTHSELGAKWNPSGLACGSCGYNGGDGSRTTGSAGSDYYHNNIQPYLVVYMYKRTA